MIYIYVKIALFMLLNDVVCAVFDRLINDKNAFVFDGCKNKAAVQLFVFLK